MPLGDSITKGWYGSVNRWGYRKPLYVGLINGDFDFDFVGSCVDGSFADPNHEGHNGWRADEILNGRIGDPAAGKLEDWLVMHQPDVILLHIGTNDITAGNQDANEVSDILDEIDDYEDNADKHVVVVLALIINRKTYSPATTQFNNEVNTMALNRIANGDDIIIVDMESALNYATDMYDNLHPNDNGYTKMADVWYDALADCVSRFNVAISGYVFEADGNTPVEGVLIQADDNDVNAVTTANGFYELLVDYNWSGVVTPQKDGFGFEPNSFYFADVNQDLTDVNYTAALMTFKIAGFVFEQEYGTPINDVNVSAENGGGVWTSRYGGGSTVTDSGGYYEVWVDYSWSGNVVLSRYGCSFEPGFRYYEDVTMDYIEDQNYTGNEFEFRITGYISNDCNMPVEGVPVFADGGGGEDITDSNGFYEIWVDSGWSGAVTPTGRFYTFDPTSISYMGVQADQTDRNYLASGGYDLDCDGYISLGDVDMMTWFWLENGTGDIDKDGDVDFFDFAELGQAW